MELQSSEVVVSNPDFMFNNIIHESTLAKFLISLINFPPPSFAALPVASTDPIRLGDLISELVLAVSYEGVIVWKNSSREPFAIDSGLAVSFGLQPITTRETVRLWLTDVRANARRK